MTLRDLALAAALLAAVSTAVYAQTKATVVTGSAVPAQKWEAFCADATSSGVKTASVAETGEPTGWNAVLKRYGEGGWEPYQMLIEGGKIGGVCFRRRM